MAKILMTKKEFEEKNKVEEATCCGLDKKKLFTLLSIGAVIAIATSAMSWIAFMNLKQNGGKLPWEAPNE